MGDPKNTISYPLTKEERVGTRVRTTLTRTETLSGGPTPTLISNRRQISFKDCVTREEFEQDGETGVDVKDGGTDIFLLLTLKGWDYPQPPPPQPVPVNVGRDRPTFRSDPTFHLRAVPVSTDSKEFHGNGGVGRERNTSGPNRDSKIHIERNVVEDPRDDREGG